MRYWKVSMVQDGRVVRQWHVRSQVLCIGSNGANAVRLPPPVAPFALRLESVAEPQDHEVGPYLLRIEDETSEREALWSGAQRRIVEAVAAARELPPESPTGTRIALLAFTLVGLTNLAASLAMDKAPKALRDFEQARAALCASQTPKPGYAARPEVQSVLVAPVQASAARVASVAPSIPFDGTGTHSSHCAYAVVAELGLSGPDIDASWSSLPPSRYRAPWPDAPLSPH
jgi:hypothetical protein